MTLADPSGKICVVTGAANGLARAMTLGLARAGAHVVACDTDEAGLAAVVERANAEGARGRVSPRPLDVRDPERCRDAVRETVARLGALDVLVNCAGLGPVYMRHDFALRPMPFWEADPERWWNMVAVNLRGPFLLAHAAAPAMIARGWGRIVNVTTSFATMIRGANMPYGQTKAGLEAGTASWAIDLEGTGVTANVLLPGGAADTDMIPRDVVVDRSRLVSPEMMIAPILYLASPASDGVTAKRFVAEFFDANAPLSAPGCAAAAWPDLAQGTSRGIGDYKKQS